MCGKAVNTAVDAEADVLLLTQFHEVEGFPSALCDRLKCRLGEPEPIFVGEEA